ncbi:MAG: DUF262 domain-containing protein [Salinarimonadaceae bacterium]|nr:MAG: DUF262 domain-containing protein [Salinarimonadaceae bacterium]
MVEEAIRQSLDSLQSKARERTVKTQNIEYDLETLIKRIDQGTIKLDPDYQRRHRWQNDVSSRLIESLLLNIPIPIIYISQDIDVDDEGEEGAARFTVIDGQQRLTAIHTFMKGNLRLEGLDILEEINGFTYKQLPPFLTRRLEERTIKCLRIDSTIDEQVKYDIFERLNTGSIKLESQELRNATARGPFNDSIKNLATHTKFRKLLQIPLDYPERSVKVQKMEDVELVLRFFALKNGQFKEMKKGLRDFLTSRLSEFNELSGQEISAMEHDFIVYMEFIYHTLGEYAFAKYRVAKGAPEKKVSSFNAAVFDAISVGTAEAFTVADIVSRADECAKKFDGYLAAFEDDEFFQSVSGATNDASKISYRINYVVNFLNR